MVLTAAGADDTVKGIGMHTMGMAALVGAGVGAPQLVVDAVGEVSLGTGSGEVVAMTAGTRVNRLSVLWVADETRAAVG